MTNRVLTYFLALLLVSWTSPKLCRPTERPEKKSTEASVYQFHPATSIQITGKTINRIQRLICRMPVSAVPSHPPVFARDEMGAGITGSGFQQNEPALIAAIGLEKVHFRYLYPSHYFW